MFAWFSWCFLVMLFLGFSESFRKPFRKPFGCQGTPFRKPVRKPFGCQGTPFRKPFGNLSDAKESVC